MSSRRPIPTVLALILLGWTLLYANPAYTMPAPVSSEPHCASMAATSSTHDEHYQRAHHHNGASCSCPHACQTSPALFTAMTATAVFAGSPAHPPVVVRHSSGFTAPPDRPPSA